MNTTMSRAFVKAGLVPQNKPCDEPEIPAELIPYTEQIKEITRLGNLFTERKIPMGLLDLGTTLAFDAMRKRGEVKEAYDYMLENMRKVASKHGLS